MRRNLTRAVAALITCVTFLTLSSASAQQNQAANAILAVCRAIGITAAQAADATACLNALRANGSIEVSTLNTMRAALTSTTVTGSAFTIFLADVLNETGAAPTIVEARAQLLALNIRPPATASQIGLVLSNPANLSAITSNYTAPISPTRPVSPTRP